VCIIILKRGRHMFLFNLVGSLLVVFSCFSAESGRGAEASAERKNSAALTDLGLSVASPAKVRYSYDGMAEGAVVYDGSAGVSVDLGSLPFCSVEFNGHPYWAAYAPRLASRSGVAEVKVVENSWDYGYKVEGPEIQEASHYTLEIVRADETSMDVDYFALPESVSSIVLANSRPLSGLSSEIGEWVYESINFSQPFESKLNSAGETVQTISEASCKKGLRNGKTLSGSNGIKRSITNQITNSIYDQYTNTDSSIISYGSSDGGKGGHEMLQCDGTTFFVTDDNIVNIIPRSLFTATGAYCYIGDAYGFYVNTYASGSNNESNIIVFDIVNTPISSKPGEIMITPVINGFVEYDKTYDAVHWDYSSDSTLALGNVHATVGMGNIGHPNIGDTDYQPREDYGYYIQGYSMIANGVAQKGDYGDYSIPYADQILKLLNFAASGLASLIPNPYAAAAATVAVELIFDNISVNQFKVDYVNECTQMIKDTNGRFHLNKTDLNNGNNFDITDDNTNLPKSYDFCLAGSDKTEPTTDPLLYKTSSDSFEVNYFSGQLSSLVNWDNYLTSTISLDVLSDTTYRANDVTLFGHYFGWLAGSLDKEAHLSKSWVRAFNEQPAPSTTVMQVDTPYYAEYCSGAYASGHFGGTANDYQEFAFTPGESGVYQFQTYGTVFDTLLYLYDSSGTQLTWDDDGGCYGCYIDSVLTHHCSLITYSLSSGTTYKIRVKGYANGAGAAYVRAQEFDEAISENGINTKNTAVFRKSGSGKKCFVFIPTASAEYSIFTTKCVSTVDTVLNVYDDAYNRVCFNDDEADGTGRLFSKVECYLTQGKTYYIFANVWGGSATSYYQFRINIIQHESLSNKSDDLDDAPFGPYQIPAGSSTSYFSFVPSQSAVYSFWTIYLSGYQDLSMQILDADMNQLAYDDDSAGNLQPLISNFSFAKNTQYYILIEKLSSASTTSQSYFDLHCSVAS